MTRRNRVQTDASQAGTSQSGGAAEVTQEPPTTPVTRDANGFELDAWGLPICGPARAARLETLGKADPHDDPDAWESPSGLSHSQASAASGLSHSQASAAAAPVVTDLTVDESGLNAAIITTSEKGDEGTKP